MKVEVLKYPTEEDWKLCKDCTLVTVNKKAINPPDLDWKKKLLASRHSPIRTLQFCFKLIDVPYFVSTHLVRHVTATPFVKSQRNDRQDKYDRNAARQDAPVSMNWYMNAETLMNIANKRLCTLADETTRKVVKMMCTEVIRTNPEFEKVLEPMCSYRGGKCTEFNCCGYNKKFQN